jgi:hypothetical protein
MWDRSLLQPLFDFDWVWEVFTPEHKRRWGYYVLPILSATAPSGGSSRGSTAPTPACACSGSGGRKASGLVARRASSTRCAWRSAPISASRALTGLNGRHTSTRRSGSSAAAREVGDCRTALGCRSISWNPFRCVVLTSELCRLVQIGFPGAGFRRLRSDLVLVRLLPAGAIPGAAPERPSGRRPTWT